MARNPNAWSVDTLGAQILGELNVDRNAAGGTVPDRLRNLVAEALRVEWTIHDWRWQHREGTLTILTTDNGDTGVALPGDFREMHGSQMKKEDENEVLVFTEDTTKWQIARGHFKVTDADHPQLGCIMRDVTETDTFTWIAKYLPPVADKDYTFPFIYLTICPLDLEDGAAAPPAAHADYKADSDAIPMPPMFHEGWRLLASAKCHSVYGNEDSAHQAWAAWRQWLKQMIAENDETMTTDPDQIVDGYDDVGALMGLDGVPQPNVVRALGLG